MADRLKERITLITDMGTKESLRNTIPTRTRIPVNMVQGMAPMGKHKRGQTPFYRAVIQAMELRRFLPTSTNGDGPLISTTLRKIVAPCDRLVISL